MSSGITGIELSVPSEMRFEVVQHLYAIGLHELFQADYAAELGVWGSAEKLQNLWASSLMDSALECLPENERKYCAALALVEVASKWNEFEMKSPIVNPLEQQRINTWCKSKREMLNEATQIVKSFE